MTTSNITSDDHINATKEAIAFLVSEYETLAGRMSVPVQGRRTTAMERLSAVTFNTVTDDLDPYSLEDLNEQLADETLAWSLFVTDLMVTVMLDARQKAIELHQRPEDYLPRLRGILLDIWLMALGELKESGGSEQEPGDAGDADDAGEWGDLAA